MDSSLAEVNIVTPLDAIECVRDQVTGVIYFSFDGQKFPESEWSDFVVIILGWWLDSLNKILIHEVSSVELRFMDGPFLVRVSSRGSKKAQVECVDDASNSIEYCGFVDIRVLFKEVLRAASDAVKLCEHYRWHTDEIEGLSRRINALSSI